LTQIEIDEVFCFVGNIRAKVAANDAVPGGAILFVKLLLDVCSNVPERRRKEQTLVRMKSERKESTK
jgi:hypothetical protein